MSKTAFGSCPHTNQYPFTRSTSERRGAEIAETLESNASLHYHQVMKFFASIVAYSIIGLILGMGIYEAVQGHLWFLAVGVVVYVLAFAKLGCLPSSKSHH
jgi:hypothetical protein